MKVSLERLATACVMGGVLLVAPAHAQMRPAAADDIIAAIDACRSAAGSGGVDETRLTGAAWQAETFGSKERPTETPLRIYAKRGNNAVLMFTRDASGPGVCIVTARIRSTADAPLVANQISSRFGAPIQAAPQEVTWRAERHILQLAPTGNRNAPSLRIGVAYVPEKAQ